jgi:hypothetical protein
MKAVLLSVLGGCLIVAGCQSAEQPPPGGAPPPAVNQSGATTGAVSIDFRSEPDPPTSGDNTIEVIVRQRDGSPVTDARVEVVFSMPAMPSMNMPAMRSAAALTHQAEGRYRGTGELSMDGTWNVAVTVFRGAEQIGSRNLSVIAN